MSTTDASGVSRCSGTALPGSTTVPQKLSDDMGSSALVPAAVGASCHSYAKSSRMRVSAVQFQAPPSAGVLVHQSYSCIFWKKYFGLQYQK